MWQGLPVMTTVSSYTGGNFSLIKTSTSLVGNAYYEDSVRGTNLVRKAAQLVSEIENLTKNPKSFDDYFKKSEDTVPLDNPEYFKEFMERIKEQLKEDDKPFTVMNFIEAQKSLKISV
jgi:hypothetical protein